MKKNEARPDLNDIFQKEMPDDERHRYNVLTVDLSMIGIYNRDISRWYHLTWGKTVEHTILLGMGAIIVIMIMWTLSVLLNADYVLFAYGILITVAMLAMFWHAQYMRHGVMFGYVKWFDMRMPDLVDPIHSVFTERGLDHVLYREPPPDNTFYVVLKLPDDGRRVVLWEYEQTTIVHVANARLRDDDATRRICGYIDEAATNV